ncbi:hypothetical protein OEA41_010358 [Lepraria neglecta]|uniref:Lipoprotein n=1 Tax=Lepraria neglecta TaxID=209136 RepID=A0AAE0DDQ5_9LECA|nr:hypothetical protein OEA41_010358 [Lepraria neglecta]
MKVNAATLVVLAGYIATTSCVPAPERITPPESSPSKPDLGPTDEYRPPGCRPLEARMPPAKMLTGYNDGPVAHWHYEKRALHDDGDDDRLEARMPPVVGPKMLTGDNDGPVAHWHYEYKNTRSLEARSPAKPR